MAAHRYWRLTGVTSPSGALELSDAKLYASGVLHPTTISFTVAPSTGANFPGLVSWADCTQSGFAIVFDAATPIDTIGLQLGAGASDPVFPRSFIFQGSDDGVFWGMHATVKSVAYPGALTLTAVPSLVSAVGPTKWNPVDKGGACTLSNADLTASSNYSASVRSVHGAVTGKYYFEVTSTAGGLVGMGTASAQISGAGSFPGNNAYSWSFYFYDGSKYHAAVNAAYAPSPGAGVVGVYVDVDAGTVGFITGGVDRGVAYSGLTGPLFAMVGGGSSGGADTFTANFGDTAFLYSPPAGYSSGFGPMIAVDPYSANVILQLQGDTLTDISPLARTLIPLGNVSVSTAQSEFGESSIYFDGVGDSLTVSSLIVGSAGEDFTIEAWVYPTALSGYRQLFYGAPGLQLVLSAGKVMQIVGGYTAESPSGVVVNTWQHVAMTRESGVIRVFLNGVPGPTQTSSAAISLTDIGSYANSTGEFLAGYMEQARITRGVCRYTASFTPVSFVSPSTFIAEAGTGDVPVTDAMRGVEYLHGSGYLDTLKAYTGDAGYVFLDVANGGDGAISGSVKEKNSPTDTPLGRRVILMEDSSRLVIRATWSDPVTGAYSFQGIKKGPRYSVISFDHLHNYRAVIADNQEAL